MYVNLFMLITVVYKFLEQEINDFHIPTTFFGANDSKTRPLPPPLQNHLHQIMYSFSAAAIAVSKSMKNNASLTPMMKMIHDELWPTTLLCGPGKFPIVYKAAMGLGLNFHGVNAVNFVGDTSAYTEAKLKALKEKIKATAPCLVYIKNIHVLIYTFMY